VKALLLLIAGRVLAFAGTVCVPVVLVRIFEPALFGTYKQLLLLYATLYAIAQLGMAESLFYFVPREPERAGRYVANAVLMLAATGLLGAVALVLGAPAVGGLLGNPAAVPFMPLLAAFLALMMAASPLEIVMIGRGRTAAAAATYGLSDLVRGLFIVVPALLFRRLDAVMIGAVAFALLRYLAMLADLRREFGPTLRPERAALWVQLAYTLPFGLSAIFEILQGTFHQYAVARQFDAAAFAVYAVGCLQIPLVDFVAEPSANLMMVRMGGLCQEPAKQHQAWLENTRRLALVFVPLTGLLLVCARDMIELLFTPAYAASVPVFTIWSMTVLLAVLQTDAVLRVFAETRLLLALSVVRLLLIMTSIGWFMRELSLVGAALATVVVLALGKGIALVRIAQLLRCGLGRLLPWRALAATAGSALGAAVPALLLRRHLEPASLECLVATGLTYGICFVGLAVPWVLTAEERRGIAAWAGRVFRGSPLGETAIEG
jgi:O-antigen/teichoic acid export membrane protein